MSIKITTRDMKTNEVNNLSYLDKNEANRTFSPTGKPFEIRLTDSFMERNIIESIKPIDVNDENEEVTVLGHKGILLNKKEIENWNGPPLSQYKFNEQKPITILKKNNSTIDYTQNVTVKYLKPPTPPPPGDLIIRNTIQPEAILEPPPQIIRQLPERSITPEPIIIREEPPEPPAPIQRKVVKVINNSLPLRRLVIEKMPKLPPKPQPIIVERWLPYEAPKRKVVYENSYDSDENMKSKANTEERSKNLVIEWDEPKINYKTSINWLGVEDADPELYKKKYGNTLYRKDELPAFIDEIENDSGFRNYVNELKRSKSNELIGDVDALGLIDLDREDLNKYKKYVNAEKKPSEDKQKSKKRKRSKFLKIKIINFKQNVDFTKNVAKRRPVVKIINNYGKLPSKEEIKKILDHSEGFKLFDIRRNHSTSLKNDYMVKKWLHFEKVNFQKYNNLIMELNHPSFNYRREIKRLGVQKADPILYKQKYGDSLIKSEYLPKFIKEEDKFYNYYLNQILNSNKLDGDIFALKYINLEKNGLSSYKKYIV